MRIAVFGLGEAGSLIAGDLASAGADVHGFDPAGVETPAGVVRHGDPVSAVADVELVLSVTAAVDAPTALNQALAAIPAGAMYADLATAGPDLAETLAAQAARQGLRFTDVALMAPVPGHGLGTPAMASGSGASDYAAAVGPLGGTVTVVAGGPGAASARKLMRSIVIKGLSALLVESLEVGAARDDLEWLQEHLVSELTAIDREFMARLLIGTESHAARRLEEMQAASELISAAGVEPLMTRGTVAWLRRVLEGGLPDVL